MPRIFGHDLLGVIASAIGIYLVGFLIYGVLFWQAWLNYAGYVETDFVGTEWKMAFSPVMPILTALTLAWLNNKAGSGALMDYLKMGAAGFIGFSGVVLLYTWVYSPGNNLGLLGIDTLHMLGGALVGSAALLIRKTPKAAASAPDPD